MKLLLLLCISVLFSDRCIAKSINQSVNQSISQSLSPLIDHSIDFNDDAFSLSRNVQLSQNFQTFQSINQSINQSYKHSLQRDPSLFGYQSTIQSINQPPPRVKNMCAMYGSCRPYVNTGGGFQPIDCPNYTEPVMPDFDMPECPMFDGPVCCDHDQYREFADGFALLKGFVSACRACVESFRAFLCSQTCSPNQALYQTINQTIVVLNPSTNQNVTVVHSVDFYVSTDLIQALYDSCKNVIFRSTGQPALDLLSTNIIDVQSFAFYILNSPDSPIVSIFHWDQSINQLDNQSISAPIIDCADTRSNVSCACYDCPHKCDRCQATNQTINLVDPSLIPLGLSLIDQSIFAPLFAYIVYLSILLGIWSFFRYQIVNQSIGQSINRSLHRTNRLIKNGLLIHLSIMIVIGVLFSALFVYVFVREPIGAKASDQSINQSIDDDVVFFDSLMDPMLIIFILATLIAMVCSILTVVVFFTPYRPVRYTREDAIDQSINQSINQQPINDAISASLNGESINQSVNQTKLSFRMRFFVYQSRLIVNHPIIILIFAILLTLACGLIDWKLVTINTDPIKLWVSPDSQVMKEKQIFDSTFGPFFRTEQIIIRVLDQSTDGVSDQSINQSTNQSIFTPERMREIAAWTEIIKSINVTLDQSTNQSISYGELCYRPIPNQGCVIESALEYFVRTADWYSINEPNDPGNHPYAPDLSNQSINQSVLIDWIDHCASQFAADECRGTIGAPTFPWVVFGGNGQSNNQSVNQSTSQLSDQLINQSANQLKKKSINYGQSNTIVITFPLNNLPENVDRAKAWEQALIDCVVGDSINQSINQSLVDRARLIGLSLSFMSERSIEDEITRGAFKDAFIIGLSYLIMFVYIGFALSSFKSINQSINQSMHENEDERSCLSYFIGLRFGLALTSILIVIASLVISIAINIGFNQSITPIISEVIPFLVLAIGIDNVFILFDAFHRQLFNYSINQSIHPCPQSINQSQRFTIVTAATLNEVGPSIILASFSEASAFLLGAATDMPAVQAFALYSAIAVLTSLVMQMTVFLAILVWDQKRVESRRMEFLICIKDKLKTDETSSTPSDRLMNQSIDISQSDDPPLTQPSVSFNQSINQSTNQSLTQSFMYSVKRSLPESSLQWLIRKFYLPFLFHRLTLILIMLVFPAVFAGLLTIGINQSIIGLDQATVLPDDSYLQSYFHDQSNYLDVGPPVYFVIPQHDQSNQSINHLSDQSISQVIDITVNQSIDLIDKSINQSTNQSLSYDYSSYPFQNLICSLIDCSDDGLMGLIAENACSVNSSLAIASNSWLDTYLQWLSSQTCCLKWTDGSYRSYDECNVGGYPDQNCSPCLDAADLIAPERPQPGNFSLFLDSWLHQSVCQANCPYCSAGLYDSIRVNTQSINHTNLTWSHVEASRYMSYHTPLRRSSDFIHALSSARSLAENITQKTGLDCFPYSIVYVYFQQYLDIERVAGQNIGAAFGAIFLLALFMMRDARLALIITCTIAFIVGDLLGLMSIWNISINALSVLNLIMAIGISVEFCIHLTVRFQSTNGSRSFRSAHSLYTIGASVFSGIALTKATGIAVLAFTSSAVFQIYYFRMYLLIVLLAVAHGLVWLPCVLALCGSEYRDPKYKRDWRDWFGCARRHEVDEWMTEEEDQTEDSDEKQEPLMKSTVATNEE